LNAELLLEKPADNPFLERFYQDRTRYALPTQLTFLFERVDQFRAAAQGELFSTRLVSDFLFDKDALFAKLTLSQVEFEFYTRAFQHLQPEVPTPDCVILLRASVPQLMQRIAQRARAMEHHIDEAYLVQLCAEYNRYFDQYDRAPLLVVDTEAFNPAESAQHFNDLLASLALLRHTRRWVLAPDQQDITT
jgi:deoxyadenosine/deoxycytidine kinase